MNFLPQNDIPDRVVKAEETLRMIARASAPEGLVNRVQAKLHSAPRLSVAMRWRAGWNGWMYSPALRGAAAAAIVCVVAGGGWSIYSHVPSAPTAKVVEEPAHVGSGGAFSNAGAMRKPDTLNGPVLAQPVAPEQIFTVTAARENAERLGSDRVSVRGHVWMGKEGSMVYDGGSKAVLPLRYSDAFTSKHEFYELMGKVRESDVATITGRLDRGPKGLILIADDIEFSKNAR